MRAIVLSLLLATLAGAEPRHPTIDRTARAHPRWQQRQAEPAPMTDEAFTALLGQIGAAPFSSDRQRVVELAAGGNWFVVAEVDQIVRRLVFSEERMAALRALAPRILDRQNAWQLDAALPFSAEREEATRLLSGG
jgi:Domain of unknown function (DUF4476)